MNKKLLLLAGILVLGATSFAADTNGEKTSSFESSRDFLDTFKDNFSPSDEITGHFGQSFKLYTDSESKDNKQIRFQNSVGVNLTKKLKLGLRTRTYLNYPGHTNASSDNLRADLSYDNGKIFGTELGFSQRVRGYRSGSNEGTYSYRTNIDFKHYIGAAYADANLEFLHTRNKSGKTKHEKQGKDTVAKDYAYSEDGTRYSDDVQTIAYDIDMGWDLGYGFSNEIEFFGGKSVSNGKTDLNALYLGLFFDHNLWSSINGTTTLGFHTEASMTPVKYNNESGKLSNLGDDKTGIVETETILTLKKKWTSNFSTSLATGVMSADDMTVHTSNAGLQGYGSFSLLYTF